MDENNNLKDVENNKNEEKTVNAKSNKILIIVLVVIIIVLLATVGVAFGLLFSGDKSQNSGSKVDNTAENKVENQIKDYEKNTINKENKAEESNITNTVSNNTTNNVNVSKEQIYKYDNLKGTYKKKDRDQEVYSGSNLDKVDVYPLYYRLELNNDGSFVYYHVPDTACHMSGYYIIKDKEITLNCLLSYANDPGVCLINQKIKLKINNDGSLVDNDIANGTLSKTSNQISETIDLANSLKEAVKSEYFSTEED